MVAQRIDELSTRTHPYPPSIAHGNQEPDGTLPVKYFPGPQTCGTHRVLPLGTASVRDLSETSKAILWLQQKGEDDALCKDGASGHDASRSFAAEWDVGLGGRALASSIRDVLRLLLGLSLRLAGDVYAKVLRRQAARRRLASPAVRMLRQLVRCVAVRLTV
jgi:hypothetical protein